MINRYYSELISKFNSNHSYPQTVIEVRDWEATVRDALFPGRVESHLAISSGSFSNSSIIKTIQRLYILMLQGSKLPLCSELELHIQRSLRILLSVYQNGIKLLTKVRNFSSTRDNRVIDVFRDQNGCLSSLEGRPLLTNGVACRKSSPEDFTLSEPVTDDIQVGTAKSRQQEVVSKDRSRAFLHMGHKVSRAHFTVDDVDGVINDDLIIENLCLELENSSSKMDENEAEKSEAGPSHWRLISELNDCGEGVNSSKGEPKPTLGNLNTLLLALESLPLALVHASKNQPSCSASMVFADLRELMAKSVRMRDEVDDILGRAVVAQSLKPRLLSSSSSSSMNENLVASHPQSKGEVRFGLTSWHASLSLSLSDVRTFVDAVAVHGVFIPRAEELLNFVEASEKWREEVLALDVVGDSGASTADRPCKVQMRRGTTPSVHANEVDESSALPNFSTPASIRRVDTLLAYGERLPFVLDTELDILRSRRAQAKIWLDRLKRTMTAALNRVRGGKRAPSKRAAALSSYQSADSNIVSPENLEDDQYKPSLKELKLMVMEGGLLLPDRDVHDDRDTPIDEGEGGFGRHGSSQNRELNKAQSVRS